MKTIAKALSVFLLLAALAFAQAPQFTTAAGIGFSRTDNPQLTGWAEFSARISQQGTYAQTVFENVTGKVATIKAAVRQNLATSGPMTLFANGAGGVVTNGQGNLGGVFDGGGGMEYRLPKWANHSIMASLAAQKITVGDPAAPSNGIHLAFRVGWVFCFGGQQ